jgi:hypothetical protein
VALDPSSSVVSSYASEFFSFGLIWMFTFLCDALARTDTRDAITEILQYSARISSGLVPTHDIQARRVYKSLSEGRKIFRLFRFIPEMKTLSEIHDDDPLIHRISVMTTSLAVAFYMLDNSIYYLETVKRKSRGDIRPVKLIKNRLALLRTISGIVLTVLEIRRFRRTFGVRSPKAVPVNLWVRLWHDSLRLWLTMHKLHLLSLFLVKNKIVETVAVTPETNLKIHILPGAIGLASAVTSLIRRTILRSKEQAD